jgi:hypothetical protein
MTDKDTTIILRNDEQEAVLLTPATFEDFAAVLIEQFIDELGKAGVTSAHTLVRREPNGDFTLVLVGGDERPDIRRGLTCEPGPHVRRIDQMVKDGFTACGITEEIVIAAGITRRGSETIVDAVLSRAVEKLLGCEPLDADEQRAAEAAGQRGLNEVAEMLTGDPAAEVRWEERGSEMEDRMPDDKLTASADEVFNTARAMVEDLDANAEMTSAYLLAVIAARLDRLVTAVERLADTIAASAE